MVHEPIISDELFEAAKMTKSYKALPKFPAVTRDIALLVDDSVLVADIEEAIRKAGGNSGNHLKITPACHIKQVRCITRE